MKDPWRPGTKSASNTLVRSRDLHVSSRALRTRLARWIVVRGVAFLRVFAFDMPLHRLRGRLPVLRIACALGFDLPARRVPVLVRVLLRIVVLLPKMVCAFPDAIVSASCSALRGVLLDS
jgi:hypothetical protein